MGLFRWHVYRGSRIALVATFAGALTTSHVSAQDTQGNWGAEGRIGSGQSASLIRWVNPSWRVVLCGGLTPQSSENATTNATNTVRSLNVTTLVRKEWGTGRVHPFVGLGPVVNLSHVGRSA